MAARVLVDLPPGALRDAVVACLEDAVTPTLVTLVAIDAGGRPSTWLEPFDLLLTAPERSAAARAGALRASRSSGLGSPLVVVLEAGPSGEPRPVRQAGEADPDGPWLPSALAVAIDRRRRSGVGSPVAPEAAQRLAETASRSARVREVTAQLRRVVATDSSVLLLGETGVGKEWYAQAIHAASPRALGPFVAVNLAAVPEALVESELFGHVAGAFTGADRGRRGLVELADGGTLFLDEVGELAPSLQPKLLRVLQEARVRPLGSDRELGIDVRVVAATNRDLEADVASGRFRSDLFYRLAVFPLRLPTLRERREDVPDLARAMLLDAALRHGRRVRDFAPRALERLASYDWPGNVRELGNAVERATLLSDGEWIDLEHLPEHLGGAAAETDPTAVDALAVRAAESGEPLELARRRLEERFERRYLEVLLTRADGRVGEVARRAGITSRALYDKLRRLGLDRRSFRSGPDRGAAP